MVNNIKTSVVNDIIMISITVIITVVVKQNHHVFVYLVFFLPAGAVVTQNHGLELGREWLEMWFT